MSEKAKGKFTATAVVISLLLLLMIGAVWEIRLLFQGRGSSAVSVDTTPGVVPGERIGPPIKVGVILSYRTGVENGWIGSPYGFDVQMRVLDQLRDPSFQIIPIVESGTESKSPMPAQLHRYFGHTPPIDGGNAAELEKLDVIVASATWRTTDAVINAVEEAVTSGVGLINGAGMGVEGPEYAPDHPAVAHVAGLIEGQYGWNSNVVQCRVLIANPLLGTLAVDGVVHMAPNGAYGILPAYATPLVALRNPHQAWGAGANLSNDPKYVFYPLYVSSLGKGRIVGCQFAPYMDMPKELQRATSGKFYIRCVRWAAGRPLK